jgi:iron complex transport system ATP-binding protein
MSPLFHIQNLSFSYGKNSVFADIQLKLQRGTFYGLIGANGSGKSTLLELLTGGLSATSGSIKLKDRAINSYSKQELACRIALVPQHFSMDFEYSVRDVVLMGRHPHIPRFSVPAEKDYKKVEKAMATMDITKLASRPVSALSGGELQRVVMARAFAQDTEILILDEATSNLDINHTIGILRVIREMVNETGLTVVAAIHDLNLAAAFCDKCVILQDRKIAANADVNSVFTKEMLLDVFGVEVENISQTKQNRPQIQFKYN